MTGMDLLDAMEHVDPKLIEAAENPPVKKKKVVPFVWTGAAAAACVAVIAGVSFVVVQNRSMSAAPAAEMAAEAPMAAEEALPDVMEEAAADAVTDAAGNAFDADAGALLAPEAAEESAKRDDGAAAENAAEIYTPAQVIAQLNEELQELAAGESGFQSIELVLEEGKPVMNVTVTKEQADLYDTDEMASDAFDALLVDLAGQIAKRLHEYSFMGGPAGAVYIEDQTEPYRLFDIDHVWSPSE